MTIPSTHARLTSMNWKTRWTGPVPPQFRRKAKPKYCKACNRNRVEGAYCDLCTHLGNKYRVDPMALGKIYQEQGGHCKVCGTFPEKNEFLRINLDPETGEIRALLCTRHQMGLGYFKTPDELERTTALLKGPKTGVFAALPTAQARINLSTATSFLNNPSFSTMRARAKAYAKEESISEEAAMSRLRRLPDYQKAANPAPLDNPLDSML